MRRIFLGVSIAAFAVSLGGSLCAAKTVEHPAAYDAFIAKQAKKHGVPERLVHRILMRESRYDPKVFHNHCYGLMQIKYGTARSMGFSGAPQGLFDPYVNMTYAIPYLANAYRVAEGDEDRAVTFFAAGYYYAAKKKQLLAALRTADSPPLAPEPEPAQAPEPQQNAMAGLFAFLQSSPPNPSQNPAAPQAEAGGIPSAAAQADAAPAALAYAGQAPTAAEAPAAEPTAPGPKPANASPKASASRSVPKSKIVVALAEKKAHPAAAAQDAALADGSAQTSALANAGQASPAAQVQTATAESTAPEPKAKAPSKASASKTAPKSASVGKARIVVALAEKSARPAEASKPHLHAAQTAKESKARGTATVAGSSRNEAAMESADAGSAPQVEPPSAQGAPRDAH